METTVDPNLTKFEQHDVAVDAASGTYQQALVAVNHSLCDGILPTEEQAVAMKHAMLGLVRELAGFDAAMGEIVSGWEVGLQAALV